MGKRAMFVAGQATCTKAPLAYLALPFLLALAATILAISSMSSSWAASSETDTSPSRAIAIAYDNSGSMVQGTTKWCSAKYSLEVLSAMLNPSDTLALYTMESPGQKLLIDGAEAIEQRVQKVHDADLGESDWTEPRAAQEAYDYLLTASGDEKYLIITTDGKFNKGNGLADVQQVVDGCAANNITVIYLAIGDEIEKIDSNVDQGIYVKLASADSILRTMTEVANQVFGRDALPASDMDVSAGKITFQVPMSKIVVFAQGENVQVGDLTCSNGEVQTGQIARVRYSDQPTADVKYGPVEIDSNLQGVVCTFSGEMPKGESAIDISGASEVEIYYTPYVAIEVALNDSGIEYKLQPGQDNEITAGTYEVAYQFLDPFTNEPLESELLYPANFSMMVESGGDVSSLGEGDSLTVSTGSITVLANAQTTGGVRVSQTYEGITVAPALNRLSIDTSSIPDTIPVSSIGQESYILPVAKEDGQPLTDAEWNALNFTVADTQDIVWNLEKSATPGEAIVSPTNGEGDTWTTQERLFGLFGLTPITSELTIKAEGSTEDNTFAGAASKEVHYEADGAAILAHTWPVLLALLIFLYFIYKYLTKPRLPRKIRPYLAIASQEEPIALSYNEGNIENRFSPWGPERIAFNAHRPKDSMAAASLRLPERYELSRIGLVACKKKDGKRCFKLDEDTLTSMRRHIDQAEERAESHQPGFPDPEYQPKPSRSLKEQPPRRITSSISFTGWNVPPAGKKKQEETYTIYFRKPQ